jgi:hypothetical protein
MNVLNVAYHGFTMNGNELQCLRLKITRIVSVCMLGKLRIPLFIDIFFWLDMLRHLYNCFSAPKISIIDLGAKRKIIFLIP